MLIVLEGLALCFVLLLVCVVGIANGPAGLVVFYEKEVQERAVELGLTTREKIKRTTAWTTVALFAPVLFLVPAMVYGMNGARGFWACFWQITLVDWIMGLFDRLFIDWYWVGRTRAWQILGTEDLMPYIPKRTLLKKWAGTLVGFPALAAVQAVVLNLFPTGDPSIVGIGIIGGADGPTAIFVTSKFGSPWVIVGALAGAAVLVWGIWKRTRNK